jgi:hypothetical protein
LASDKQIAANRANAKKSTGPKTAAGKLKSAQNARRHGLSSPLQSDPTASAKADALARAIAGEGTNENQLESAMAVAYAQLELDRIRITREDLMTTFDFIHHPDIRRLWRIAALDRYDRYALTKRRQAARKL